MSQAADLIKALIAGIQDGSLTPAEASEVLQACAALVEALADQRVKSWWGRLVLSAAAGAILQAADEVKDLPSMDT
jgi:rhamnogalacturonyl hydrolase YesR